MERHNRIYWLTGLSGVGLQVELPDAPDLVLDNNGDKTPEQQVARLRTAALGLEG